MKKFYILFLAIPILSFTLLYLSEWWLIAGLGVVMIFIVYQLYSVRLYTSLERIKVLDEQIGEFNIYLQNSILKEQKTSKEAEETWQMKQQLLSIISHEIRTPMNSVLGMTLLLEDTPLTEEQQDYLNTIRSSGESLLTTVNNALARDILNSSKLQQEGNDLDSRAFNLRNCIEEVLELFAEKAGKANVDLIYEIDANVPVQVIVNWNQLRQILINLVENALKFTRSGEVFLGVKYPEQNTANSQHELNFEVRDTGIGMATEQLNHLFAGIQGRKYLKEQIPASAGLGLVICRKLVERMKGRIEVKSVQGQGSSFLFSIPLVPCQKTIRDHARHDNMINLEGRNIFIIDDNPTSRNMLIRQMKSWKMLPVFAESGNEAKEILKENKPFDLVIADLNMQGMESFELLEAIRDLYPGLPIIGMNHSANKLYNQEPELLFSVLTRPIKHHNLRDCILAALPAIGTAKPKEATVFSENFSRQYPLRILVAEDDAANQKVALKILTKLGYKPAMVNNGKEAIEMVSQDPFDIILMDVQMPEMDGLQATRLIRTCLEKQPIIIALTANVMQGDLDACMQSGMDDYMSKPIELRELLDQLEKWALLLREKQSIKTTIEKIRDPLTSTL